MGLFLNGTALVSSMTRVVDRVLIGLTLSDAAAGYYANAHRLILQPSMQVTSPFRYSVDCNTTNVLSGSTTAVGRRSSCLPSSPASSWRSLGRSTSCRSCWALNGMKPFQSFTLLHTCSHGMGVCPAGTDRSPVPLENLRIDCRGGIFCGRDPMGRLWPGRGLQHPVAGHPNSGGDVLHLGDVCARKRRAERDREASCSHGGRRRGRLPDRQHHHARFKHSGIDHCDQHPWVGVPRNVCGNAGRDHQVEEPATHHRIASKATR